MVSNIQAIAEENLDNLSIILASTLLVGIGLLVSKDLSCHILQVKNMTNLRECNLQTLFRIDLVT